MIFLSPDELINSPNMVDDAKKDGYQIVTIPETLKAKISGTNDINGNKIRNSSQYLKEYKESFQYDFVNPKKLKPREKEIFNLTDDIFDLIGGRPSNINEILVSETMRKDYSSDYEPVGQWFGLHGRIIIKRSQLNTLNAFAYTLLHETAHAISGAPDVDRAFEMELSNLLGIITDKSLSNSDHLTKHYKKKRSAKSTDKNVTSKTIKSYNNKKTISNRTDPSVDKLINELDGPNRNKAVQSLVKNGNKAFKQVILATQSQNHVIRRKSCDVLGIMGNANAVIPLTKLLKDSDKYVRRRAAKALVKVGNKNAVNSLIEALNDNEKKVRYRAANALGNIGDKKAIGPLQRLSNDPNYRVRENARQALKKLNSM